jgi:hypothetical protein
MPLPRAQARNLIHTRIIDCRGYERDDGLWDIEGHLTDAKTYTWKNRGHQGDLAAGEPAHDMWLRLTIDANMVIHEAIAATDAGPFAPCGDITTKFSQLKGKRIARGWTKALREILGGPNGCTHHWELLGRVATVAYQATHRVRHEQHARKPGELPHTFNTCHMYTPESIETLHQWPDLYTGPKPRSLENQS